MFLLILVMCMFRFLFLSILCVMLIIMIRRPFILHNCSCSSCVVYSCSYVYVVSSCSSWFPSNSSYARISIMRALRCFLLIVMYFRMRFFSLSIIRVLCFFVVFVVFIFVFVVIVVFVLLFVFVSSSSLDSS